MSNDFLDSHRRAEAVADNYELEQPPAFTGTVEQLEQHIHGLNALDALEAMACAFGKELDAGHSTLPQQRAWRFAKCVLVEAGRKVRDEVGK